MALANLSINNTRKNIKSAYNNNKFKLSAPTWNDEFDSLESNSNNNDRQASKVLFIFVPNKQFGQLIDIPSHSLTMLNTTYAKFSFNEVWFTDQNNRPPEIEDNVIITLIIGAG